MTTSDAEPSSSLTSTKAAWSWGSSASNAEAAEFVEHLAALTRTGLPLPSGLRSLAAELPSRRLRRPLEAMADRLEHGESLDASIVGIVWRFPAPLRGLMIAGGRSGKLADVLGQYVRYASLGRDLRRRFWMSIAYPVFLLLAVMGLYLFLCFWVVEAFEFVLKDFGVEETAVTQLLFLMAEATRTRGLQVVTLVAILAAIGYLAFRMTMGPAERRMLVSTIPMFGPLLRWTSLAEFCHLTGLLVESEMPLPDALELSGRGAGDAELAKAGESLRSSVEDGRTLSEALVVWPRCPAGLTEVLADSESRGDLAPSLHLAGDMFEARARAHASFMTTFFAAMTLLIILWGGGFVVTALYLPIIHLMWKLM